MKLQDKVKILEDEVENLRELAGETLATCLINIKRGNLVAADKPNGGAATETFKKYFTVRMAYLRKIEARLRAAKL